MPAAATELLNKLFWPVAGVLVALAVLAWLLLRLNAWFRDQRDGPTSAHEMLSHYRDMRKRGEISEEEYRSIRRHLAGELAPPVNEGPRSQPETAEPGSENSAG